MMIRILCFGVSVCFLLSTCGLASAQDGASDTSKNASPPRNFADARAFGQEKSNYRQQHVRKITATPKANLGEFKKSIQPILKNNCVPCHGGDAQEGNIRIDTLSPDLLRGKDTDWWLEVQAVLTKGEMPPPDDSELSDVDRSKVINWLSNEIQVASIVRRATSDQSSFRRMTRYEFNYALQDLLGLPYEFAKDLPPEANSEDGFQNSSDLLHMSVSQLETYRRLARKALLRATVQGERPPVVYWGVTMDEAGRIDWKKQTEEFEKAKKDTADDPKKQKQKLAELEKKYQQPHGAPYYQNLQTGRTVRASWAYYGAKYANHGKDVRRDIPAKFDHVAILPRGNHRFNIELGNRVPDEGVMRVRVLASQADPNAAGDLKNTPTLQLLFGWQASNEGRAILSVPNGERKISTGPDKPQFYEWNVPLGDIYPRNSVRKTSKIGAMPNPSEYIRLTNSSVSQGPIRIDYVEVAAPVFDEWPPASHKQIFIESSQRDDEPRYARQIFKKFMQRAWRRPVVPEEVEQKLKLFSTMRPVCDSFEEAVVEVLSTVLASPQFLYIVGSDAPETDSKPGNNTLAAHELATRLSMFLWSSVPDAELNDLAASGRLLQPDILYGQVVRMLAEPHARRLSKHFVRQWLDMQLLDFRNLPRGLGTLKQAMQQEPIAVFDEMLRTDASVLDFLHADYTMANERLAAHYGLPNVKGNEFRRVPLTPNQRRGGLLTQAGLLAMNSAGDDSHPLKRGVWLLESLLNDPPPPPPPAVPEIDLADPKIAKMTLKEQIENHRNHAACMSCHAKIDPWGIAFENYDALGRWRNQVKGKPVDATSKLFNNEPLAGMDGLKRYLLENRQDQFVRAMVHKLATYGLGRPLTFSDYSAVDEITAKVRQQGDGLATMIQLIVLSDLFRTK